MGFTIDPQAQKHLRWSFAIFANFFHPASRSFTSFLAEK
jgi:hypothetical protein